MLDKKKADDILVSVIKEYQNKYAEILTRKATIRNKRTEEGLNQAIYSAVNEFTTQYAPKIDTIEQFEAVLRNKVERSTFFYMNEPLIWKIVRKFDNLPIDETDRYAAAAKGFVVAQNIFDPTRGFQFSTIAWHIMCNEIIGLNKKRLRQTIVKMADKEVYCRDSGTITIMEHAKDARIIKIKGEPVQLWDITVEEDDGAFFVYRYIYDPKEAYKVGTRVTKGELIGHIAGAETDLISIDSFNDPEHHSEVIFHNPLSKKDDDYGQAENVVLRDAIMDKFYEIVNRLEPLEQFVVKKRLLPRKPKSRTVVAKEMGLTDIKLATIEKNTIAKLKEELLAAGITKADLDIF